MPPKAAPKRRAVSKRRAQRRNGTRPRVREPLSVRPGCSIPMSLFQGKLSAQMGGYIRRRIQINYQLPIPQSSNAIPWTSFAYVGQTSNEDVVPVRCRLYVLQPMSKPVTTTPASLTFTANTMVLAGMYGGTSDSWALADRIMYAYPKSVEVVPSASPVWKLVGDVDHQSLYSRGFMPFLMSVGSDSTQTMELIRLSLQSCTSGQLVQDIYPYTGVDLKLVYEYLVPMSYLDAGALCMANLSTSGDLPGKAAQSEIYRPISEALSIVKSPGALVLASGVSRAAREPEGLFVQTMNSLRALKNSDPTSESSRATQPLIPEMLQRTRVRQRPSLEGSEHEVLPQ